MESSSLQAIEKIRKTDFDIIFADYKMPTVNGIEFPEVVKDDYKNGYNPFHIPPTAGTFLIIVKKNTFVLHPTPQRRLSVLICEICRLKPFVIH